MDRSIFHCGNSNSKIVPWLKLYHNILLKKVFFVFKLEIIKNLYYNVLSWKKNKISELFAHWIYIIRYKVIMAIAKVYKFQRNLVLLVYLKIVDSTGKKTSK